MVVLNRFCYWFSTRFGALIVGIITLVQCSIWFMVSIISLDNLDIVRETLKIFLENLNLQNSFLSHLSRDPHIYLIVLNVLVSLLFVSTIIMVVGAFKCKSALLMPFLIVNLLYIISMTLQHIFLMINYKKKESGGLGALIFYTNIGGLILRKYFLI
ncbi:uncharacterized protein [Onthophagus taurus]|uniref:uncharacterized protein n=1 Tax=Onthophagus taurus TaxID=166361 RepID=UPI0039BE45E7